MPARNIERDDKDSSILVQHRTDEISPLPGWAAANKWTGFLVIKEGEDNMSLDIKGDYLRKLGFSDEKIAGLEQQLGKSSEALEAVVEFKEETTEEVVEEVKKEEEVVEVKDEIVAEVVPDVTAEQQFALEMADLLSPVVEAINGFGERINSIEAEIKELKVSDSQKIAELKEETPQRSLDTLKGLLEQTLIGKDEARVDGRLSLAKDGPVETKDEAERVTPIPTLNRILSSQRA
jgi:hypothetical protein